MGEQESLVDQPFSLTHPLSQRLQSPRHSRSFWEIALWPQTQQDTEFFQKLSACSPLSEVNTQPVEQMLASKAVPAPTVMDSSSILFTLPGRVINSPSNQVHCFSLSDAPTLLMNDSLKLAAEVRSRLHSALPLLCKVMPSHLPNTKSSSRVWRGQMMECTTASGNLFAVIQASIFCQVCY